jgi:glutamate N-acetyltransferase / amino-acid N-acetyltransferase
MAHVELATGYRFSGVHSGLRPDPDRKDLALVVSDRPARAAGVFTQNRVMAAPVHWCKGILPSNGIRGIIICSGNANACTGEQGLRDAEKMATLTAYAIGSDKNQVLVCSTGVIGRLLPMPVFETGIPLAEKALTEKSEGLEAAATAIMTTDTVIKLASRSIEVAGQKITLTGFSKGAAMIGPNMATMLGFVLTDASVETHDLQQILRQAADRTFNCISVEGHTSTNDTVLILANGTTEPLKCEALQRFAAAVHDVCQDLARAIARDAEGANHLVTIEVEGCRTESEARTIAKTIADSALVKTAIYGADPNWGRFVSAAGYSGVAFEEKDLSLWMGDLELYRDGTPLPFDAKTASAYLKNNREITLRLKFKLGTSGCTFYTCDLTTEYVRLNADYTT